jgi:hypothetical protein
MQQQRKLVLALLLQLRYVVIVSSKCLHVSCLYYTRALQKCNTRTAQQHTRSCTMYVKDDKWFRVVEKKNERNDSAAVTVYKDLGFVELRCISVGGTVLTERFTLEELGLRLA